MVLRGGVAVAPPDTLPIATVTIRDYSTLVNLIFNPEVGFGDGYAEGAIEVDGDLVEFLEAAYRSWPIATTGPWLTRLASCCTEHLQANTLRRSRANVHHHYDLKTDFYHQWLDPTLVYTCAYFPTPSATLEEA
jgi:cyclopropane-fatty-acyl-phospholipid synthase